MRDTVDKQEQQELLEILKNLQKGALELQVDVGQDIDSSKLAELQKKLKENSYE